MPEFRGRYRFRRVQTPRGDSALRGFTCGVDDHGVDMLVKNQFVGKKCARYPAIWILEDITTATPRTMGVSAWILWASPVARIPKPLDEVYVHMIALAAPYRRHWLPKPDNRRLGHLLLAESLTQIKSDWSPNPMPAVWASVAQHNEKSANMFGAHGFTRYFPVPGWSEAIVWRPPNLGVD